jgi:hypothetical protein
MGHEPRRPYCLYSSTAALPLYASIHNIKMPAIINRHSLSFPFNVQYPHQNPSLIREVHTSYLIVHTSSFLATNQGGEFNRREIGTRLTFPDRIRQN